MTPEDLRDWRERNGYSQGKLAVMLGVDVMTISRWERGVREIPSFLSLALEALEKRGVKKSRDTKTRKEGKHGKKDKRTL